MANDARSFAVLTEIENGEHDRFLHRLHGAIHLRQQTTEYHATLVAGEQKSDDETP